MTPSPDSGARGERPLVVSDVETRTHTSWLRRRRFEIAGSLLIAAGFGWLLHAGALPLVPDAQAFSHVRLWTVGAYIVIWSLVHIMRAARWSLLIKPVHPVPLRRVVAVAFIGFAAIVLLPFRAGEVVRPVLIRRKGHLSGWAATGTVGAERVIDGLCLSVLLFIALQLSHHLDPLPDRIGDLKVPVSVVPGAAYAALAVFAVAFSVMGLFYWRRAWARRTCERVVGLVSKPLASWIADRVEQVAAGLGFLQKWRYALPFLAVTVAYWVINTAAAWLLAWGCGFDSITFWQSAVDIGVLALGILLPNAPGFFGAFQISIYAGFAMFFEPRLVTGPGSAFVFIIYLSQLFITVTAAVVSMIVERTSLADALSATPVELEPAVGGADAG